MRFTINLILACAFAERPVDGHAFLHPGGQFGGDDFQLRITHRVHGAVVGGEGVVEPSPGGSELDNRSEAESKCNGDSRRQIDNNLVENAIRPTALGKKNYLFFGEVEAGETSAILYTVIENARRRSLDPQA